MSPEDALESARSLINENGRKVFIRRYSGTGPTRSPTDTVTQAYVRTYASKELVGAIAQGDQVAVALVDALSAILPVRTTDFLVLAKDDGMPGADEYAIKNPMQRVVGGVLIALEMHCAG